MLEPPSKLHIIERRLDDVTVLELVGEMTLDDGDLVFRRKIHELLDEGRVKILLDLGCSTGQGFLFSRPVGADHVARLLDRPLPLPSTTPTNSPTKLLQPTSQDAA